MVVLQRISPEGIQTLGSLGLPVGLMLIEVGRAGLANLVRDGLAPRQPGMTLRIVVEYVNQ